MRSAVVLVLLLSSCGIDTGPGTGPRLDSGAQERPSARIDGRARFQGIELRYSAGFTEQGIVARYEVAGEVVEIHMPSESYATLTYQGVTVDGFGALSPVEQATLTALASRPWSPVLALVPLELGCSAARQEARYSRAALLFPWQLLLKYGPAFPTPRALERVAACKYFVDDVRIVTDAHYYPPRPPGGLAISIAEPFPFVVGVAPLDDVGGVLRMEWRSQPILPPTCRGTCGANCDTCQVTRETRCQQDSSGKNTGVQETIATYFCDTHSGCRTHDACYDACLAAGQPFWSLCHGKCDQQCINQYGSVECNSWRTGGGPYDGQQTFTHVEQTQMARECDPVVTFCGDGKCVAPGESCENCSSDCPARNSERAADYDERTATPSETPGMCGIKCGNGVCDYQSGETCASCAQDCSCEGATCGDGTCLPDAGEDCTKCPQDCQACSGQCGNGACDTGSGESCSSCPADCPCGAESCGDGQCDVSDGESCASCPSDCSCDGSGGEGGEGGEAGFGGSGGGYCGDGMCDFDEDCSSCSDCDCGSGGEAGFGGTDGAGGSDSGYCGDGVCDYDEDCSSCSDCDCGSGGEAGFGGTDGAGGSGSSYCGDGSCDFDEDCSFCSTDCGEC
jgi:hypothetical protein